MVNEPSVFEPLRVHCSCSVNAVKSKGVQIFGVITLKDSLPSQGNVMTLELVVMVSSVDIKPSFSSEIVTGKLHTCSTYDPSTLLVTCTNCGDVILTSLTGFEQSDDRTDIVFCNNPQVPAAKKNPENRNQKQINE